MKLTHSPPLWNCFATNGRTWTSSCSEGVKTLFIFRTRCRNSSCCSIAAVVLSAVENSFPSFLPLQFCRLQCDFFYFLCQENSHHLVLFYPLGGGETTDLARTKSPPLCCIFSFVRVTASFAVIFVFFPNYKLAFHGMDERVWDECFFLTSLYSDWESACNGQAWMWHAKNEECFCPKSIKCVCVSATTGVDPGPWCYSASTLPLTQQQKVYKTINIYILV